MKTNVIILILIAITATSFGIGTKGKKPAACTRMVGGQIRPCINLVGQTLSQDNGGNFEPAFGKCGDNPKNGASCGQLARKIENE